MKTISLVLVTALSFAAGGCKKHRDCAGAIDTSMELSKADMQKTPGMDDKMMQTLKTLGVQRCEDDKWSDDAINCMFDAKTETDSHACYGKLSSEQQAKMNVAAMKVMMTSGAGSAGSATGSASGSAGSASGG